MRKSMPKFSRGNARVHAVGRDLTAHQATRSDNGAICDGDAAHDHRIRTDPNVVADFDLTMRKRRPAWIESLEAPRRDEIGMSDASVLDIHDECDVRA